MEAVTKVNRAERIDVKDEAREIRETLKTAFPERKFSVRIHRYAGGANIEIAPSDWDLLSLAPGIDAWEADVDAVTEALWAFVTLVRAEVVSDEERYNGNNGWNHLTFARVEEDGSITPTYYGVSVYYRDTMLMRHAKGGN